MTSAVNSIRSARASSWVRSTPAKAPIAFSSLGRVGIEPALGFDLGEVFFDRREGFTRAADLGAEGLGFLDADLEFVVLDSFLAGKGEAAAAFPAGREAAHGGEGCFLRAGELAVIAALAGLALDFLVDGVDLRLVIVGASGAETRFHVGGVVGIDERGFEFRGGAGENAEAKLNFLRGGAIGWNCGW